GGRAGPRGWVAWLHAGGRGGRRPTERLQAARGRPPDAEPEDECELHELDANVVDRGRLDDLRPGDDARRPGRRRWRERLHHDDRRVLLYEDGPRLDVVSGRRLRRHSVAQPVDMRLLKR